MPTSHDVEDTVELAAIAGGGTAGAMIALATSSAVAMHMLTRTSSQTIVVKYAGLIKGVNKSTAAAWTHGAQLSYTATVFAIATVGGLCVATAYGAHADTAATADVILSTPRTA